ncbi:TetR/AcrR family transcriptional regulator [Sphingomonas sp. PAMC 26605]|uniref:TetR/AcrR family transcriptional regulator n=1 Tax=Sphingomonas sp. PAMC 26605 TaxID=1112214 RepID=UPI0009DB6D40|nr:TetR/AcrR family transcriptional regulator [Sphingomonas sp. PAMC 26605]
MQILWLCVSASLVKPPKNQSRQTELKPASPLPIETRSLDSKPLARGRKSAKKRETIVRAAIEIINEKSFALATMSDIAASIDLRDATLYYYFPNKQTLVYECHVRSLARFERLIVDAAAFEGPGMARIKQFVRTLIDDSFQNGPQLYFGDYSYLEPIHRDNIAKWAIRLRDMLEDILRQGMADGSIVQCETGLVVQLILGMLIWLAKWASDVHKLTPDRLMAAIEAFSFHGLESRG